MSVPATLSLHYVMKFSNLLEQDFAGRRSERVHKNLSKAGKKLSLYLIARKMTLSLDLLRNAKLNRHVHLT